MSSLTWPPERFYWAVLEAPGVRAGVLPAGLMATLQEEVPIAVESLHAVMTPLKNGRLLVCAAPREELETLAPGTLSLRPAGVPAFTGLDENTEPPELLVGPYEPRVLRRERTRRWVTAAAAMTLIASFVSIGLIRRAQALTDYATAANDRTDTLLVKAGYGTSPDALAREIARLREVNATKQPLLPPDAAETITALLRAWPAGLECEPSAISINATSMTLALSVDGDARPLLSVLRAPQGWTLEEPRLSAHAGSTRVSLTLRRASGGAE